MKPILLLMPILIGWYNVFGTNYYVSQQGNDTNKGTKEHPWQSLNKITEFNRIAQPGDSIFFERGSTFKGQLNISCSGLYVGAYGKGTNPTISGSSELTGWTLLKGNIWKSECTDCTSDPNNLFIDNHFQVLGRYPNQGYLAPSAYGPKENSITDSNLNFQDSQMNGSEIVIRSSRWTIDRLSVSNFKNKTFYTSEKPSYELTPGFGYFIQNHFSTLDQHGEWYFDSQTKQLFIFLENNFKPSQHTIEVNMTETGLTARNASDLVIENIVFDKQMFRGVKLQNCTNARLNKIEITNSGRNGMEIASCKNPVVENSLIRNSNNNGVEWNDCPGGTFSHNRILRTGLHAGRGASGNGTYIAFYSPSSNNLSDKNSIDYNIIDSTGYSGIDFRTSNTLLKNNSISNFCLVKDDGAGIYTWKNSGKGNLIERNTIRNGIGSGEGTVNKDERYASGIYMDDHTSNIYIKNNSVSNCSMAGIFIHNAQAIVIGNILYANGKCLSNREKGQLYIKLDSIGKWKGEKINLEVSQNKFMATSENVFCLFLSADKKEDLYQLGTFGQNQFTAYHPEQAIALSSNQYDVCSAPEEYTLAEWQKISTQDKESTFKILSSKGNFATAGTELIHTQKYNSSTEGWMTWPAQSSLQKEKIRSSKNYSLKINITPEMKEALLYHAGIHFANEKVYRLTFSAASTKPSKIEFVPLMANSPWAALGKYACFLVDTTFRTYTYYFKCDKNDVEARANFKSNSTFWIKDITLFEVVENSVTGK